MREIDYLRNFWENTRGQSVSRRFKVLKNIFLSLFRLPRPLNSQPVWMQVEPTSRCNLDCVMCVRKKLKPWGDMSLEEFKSVMDKLPLLYGVQLQGQGEPLLNEELFDMISYANNKGVDTTVVTNGTLLSKKNVKRLLESGLDEVVVSVDSHKKEVYEKIRRGAKFDNVITNIQGLVKQRNKQDSHLKISFWVTVMRNNFKEIHEFVEFADDLGIDEVVFRVMRVNPDYKERYDKDFIKGNFITQEELNSVKRKIKRGRTRVIFKEGGKCWWPWQGLYVSWDGEVTPCCVILDRKKHSIGNIIKQDFKDIWYSGDFIKFRKDLIERRSKLCQGCRNW